MVRHEWWRTWCHSCRFDVRGGVREAMFQLFLFIPLPYLLASFSFLLSSLASSHLFLIPGVNRKDFSPFPITPKINFLHHFHFLIHFSCLLSSLDPTQRVHRCITARRWTARLTFYLRLTFLYPCSNCYARLVYWRDCKIGFRDPILTFRAHFHSHRAFLWISPTPSTCSQDTCFPKMSLSSSGSGTHLRVFTGALLFTCFATHAFSGWFLGLVCMFLGLFLDVLDHMWLLASLSPLLLTEGRSARNIPSSCQEKKATFLLRTFLRRHSWAGFAYTEAVLFLFHAVSPRPGLVKLLALSNFQARRRSPRDSCFTGHFRQFVVNSWYCTCHRCVLPYDWMRGLVTGISNPMTPLLVHRRWLDSGMVLSSLTHSTSED